MLADARNLPNGFEVHADYCVLGAGAAGIAIARELAHVGRTVVLVESGGLEYDEATQQLYAGENTGLPYFPLQTSRLRAFGGSTGLWGGWCRPLDPLDFETRAWVPDSGWPITRKDLDPYYARSQEILDLGPYEFDVGFWERMTGKRRLELSGDEVVTRIAQLSLPTKFGEKYRDELTRSGRIKLLLWANVSELVTTEDGAKVTAARIKCLGGKQGSVKAGHYVLACGGIENPRILLLSNRQNGKGIGNARDLVGRYFNEHPCLVGGFFQTRRPEAFAFYSRILFETPAVGYFTTSESHQERRKTLNFAAFATEQSPDDPRLLQNHVGFAPSGADLLKVWAEWESAYRAQDASVTDAQKALQTVSGTAAGGHFSIPVHLEQAPNRDSRVTLSDELDALGLRRTRLEWRLTSQEKRTLRDAIAAFGVGLQKAGVGEVRMPEWLTADDTTWPDLLTGEWHHMGTTRMGTDTAKSVVDPNCRVHGVHNLFVAGSSVFPTGGSANPTHTLVALALRLADHLRDLDIDR